MAWPLTQVTFRALVAAAGLLFLLAPDFVVRSDLVGTAPDCDNASSPNCAWSWRGEMLEYMANANPPMAEVPVRVFPASLHESPGPSRVIQLDLSEALKLPYPATAPNLLASFVRVNVGEVLETGVEHATSQAFYVIRGVGASDTRAGTVHWQTGDLFVLPYLGDEAKQVCKLDGAGRQCVRHACEAEKLHKSCALYWVDDEPLLRYLGARPVDTRRFEPTLYPADAMRAAVEGISSVNEATGEARNRRGILLASPDTPQTKTLTPTLWSLLNSIGPGQTQFPHRHNSVALDLAVMAGDPQACSGKVYTLLGRELGAIGNIVDPLRVAWEAGSVFVTPPGWWHSHHNECTTTDDGDVEVTAARTAWVLPMQDAGLYTHQRTLDIRFVADEAKRLQSGVHRGATSEQQPVAADKKDAQAIYRSTVPTTSEVNPTNIGDAAAAGSGKCNNAPAPAVLAGTILMGHAEAA